MAEMMTTEEFLGTLEDEIAKLPQEIRAKLYRPCATKCVKGMALPELRRQFEECGQNIDAQFTKYGRSPFFFADIIEPGHVYEIGYPQCVCNHKAEGRAFFEALQSGKDTRTVKPLRHDDCEYLRLREGECECSRQSILYVMHDLLPDKEIEVEMMHTFIGGASECRFKVTVK